MSSALGGPWASPQMDCSHLWGQSAHRSACLSPAVCRPGALLRQWARRRGPMPSEVFTQPRSHPGDETQNSRPALLEAWTQNPKANMLCRKRNRFIQGTSYPCFWEVPFPIPHSSSSEC